MMSLMSSLKAEYAECVRLITTDRKLQSFMLCVFSMLALVIFFGFGRLGFGPAESYYLLSDRFLGGDWDYDAYGMNLPPLVIPILLLIKSLSPDYDVFCVLLSLSGFAFYMLGGHFLLKLCRETGYPEKNAFLLLLLMFLCTLTGLTTGIATISASLIVISMWLYRRDRIGWSFAFLALATWAGFYPVLLFLTIFFIRLRRRELKSSAAPIVAYILAGLPLLLLVPHMDLSDAISLDASIGWLRDATSYSGSAVEGLLISIMWGTVLCILLSISVRREVSGIRAPVLLLLVTLFFISLWYPYSDDFFTVTVFMLFILSRMGSDAGRISTYMYASLAIYGFAELINDFVIETGCLAYSIVSAVSLAALTVTIILLSKEFGELCEHPSKK